MFNSVCGPEMSFNGEALKTPHAYVAYADGDKETKPLTWILNFPKKWRASPGWDKNYLYKVFWSPDDDDSPAEMLKRCPEIPTHEPGSSMEKPGYYRACVLLVKESLKELENHLDHGKRVSVGSSKTRYSSFDQKLNASKDSKKAAVTSRASKVQSNDKNPESKPLVLKKKKAGNKVSKKKGIALDANCANTSTLRSDLSRRFKYLNSKTCETESEDDCGGNMDDAKETNEMDFDSSVGDNNVSESGKKTKSPSPLGLNPSSSNDKLVKEEGRENDNTVAPVVSSKGNAGIGSEKVYAKSPVLPSPKVESDVKPNKASDLPKRSRRARTPSDSSSSEDSQVTSKQMKLDPDFTPRKYERAKEEVVMLKQTNKKVYDLNVKLQGKVLNLEDEIDNLKKVISDLQNNQLKKCSTCSAALLKISPLSNLAAKPLKVNRNLFGHSKEDIKDATNAKEDKNENGDYKLDASSDEDENDIKIKDGNVETDELPRNGIPSINCNDNNDDGDDECLPPQFCEAVLEDQPNDDTDTVTLETDGSDTRLVLCAGVTLEKEVREFIWNRPDTEKGDIGFIKDLCTAAFGPEVLASCSVKGTKKGGPKKKADDDDPKESKPGLNKDILDAVYHQFVKRVARIQGTSVANAEDLARCSKTVRFNPAIRDIQKKWRRLGYGNGTQSNAVNIEVLQKK